MAILDMIVKQVAPMLGKNPTEIMGALNQAKKLTQGMENNLSGAKKILQSQGIPVEFLDKAADLAKPFAGLVGMDANKIDGIKNELKGDTKPTRNSGFVKKKYPKL